MSYSVQNIRNVALLGHGGNGKTSLVESMLYLTGALDRQGRTADGNTVCDYDAEEIKRQITISTAVAPVEYNGCKINVLDTPGNYDFSGDVQEALRVAELGIIVCDAKSGLSVGTERAWKYLNEHKAAPLYLHLQDWTRTMAISTAHSPPCVSTSAAPLPRWSSPSGTTPSTSPALWIF